MVRQLLSLLLHALVFRVAHGAQLRGSAADARPHVHFTPDRGWMNDPNGHVYHDGEYHLFFQRTKDSKRPGSKSWGHAVSSDLLHWEQLADAIVPDIYSSSIWSGSAVVDHSNTSGLQIAGQGPPMIAFFTYVSWGQPFEQHMAVSHDKGRTWTASGKPVIPAFAEDNRRNARDPKVQWHGQSQKWIMVLWVEHGQVLLYASPDLRSWRVLQQINFEGAFECPDFIELEDARGLSRWVLMMGDGSYEVGDFDGERFAPFTGRRSIEFGSGYASQTFNGVVDKIQISWIRDKTHPIFEDVPFVGMMSFPMKLELTDENFVRRSPIWQITRMRNTPVLLETAAYYDVDFVSVDTAPLRSLSSSHCALEAVIRAQVPPLSSMIVEFKHPENRGLQVHLIGNTSDVGPRAEIMSAESAFFKRKSMPLSLTDTHMVEVTFLVDWGVIEVFDVRGQASMAAYSSELATYVDGQCSPKLVEFRAFSGGPRIQKAIVYPLNKVV